MMTQHSNHWQNQAERINVKGMRFLIGVYRLLGARVCAVFTYPVLLYYFWCNKTLRQTLLGYYKHLQQIDEAIKPAPFANVKQFGLGMIDRLTLWTGQADQLHIQRYGHEDLYECARAGQGGVIFTSHLGNFELSRAAGRMRLPAPINVIVDYANAQKINAVMQAVNEEFMDNIIAVEQIDITLAIQLKEKVDNGEFVVIAVDRVNQKSAGHSLRVPFLGQSAAFPTGPYVLAKVLACPVFSLYAFRRGMGQYDVYFHRLFDRVTLPKKHRDDAIKDYMQHYAKQLQHYCLRFPDQWFNFYNFWDTKR